MLNHDSKIPRHVHENNHEMDPGSVRAAAHEANPHERVLPEPERQQRIHNPETTTWPSQKSYYKSPARTQVSRHIFPKLHTEPSSARSFNALPLQSHVPTLIFQLIKAQAPAEMSRTKHQTSETISDSAECNW